MDIQTRDGIMLRGVPEGTPDEEIKARIEQIRGGQTSRQPESAPPPTDTAVGLNALNKGLAGVPDAVLNAPQNVINLAKAGYGTAATAMGRPDLAPDITPPPSYAHRAMESMGFIKPENEPQGAKQRIIDTAAQGAGGMAGAPADSVRKAITNVLMGITGGGAGGVTKEVTGSEPLALTASMLTPLAPAAGARMVAGKPLPMNEVKAKTLAEGRDADYAIPGSETNSGWINRRIEDFAGKAALKQQATVNNQANTNKLMAEELGLPADTGITPRVLDAYRQDVSGPYREVAALSSAAAKNLDKLKDVRAESTLHWQDYRRNQRVDSIKSAKALDAQAEMIENELENIAARRGRPELIDELREARVKVAKSWDVQRNLNKGSGDVSAPGLGDLLDREKPLSGRMKVTAAMAEAFPRYMAEGPSTPPADVSGGKPYASGVAGGAGFLVGGPAGAAVGASIPYLSNPLRSMALSPGYQKMLANSGKNPTEAEIRALLLARAIAERNGAQQ